MSLGLASLLTVLAYTGTALAQEPQKVRILLGRSAVLSVPDSIGTVSIADDRVADVVVATSRQLLLNAKKIGTTSLVVWSKGNRYQTYEVVVHSGTGFNQVVLNVKVAEVNRQRLKELGFDFFVSMLNSRRIEGSATVGFFGGNVVQARIPILRDPLGERVTAAFKYTSLSGDREIGAVVRALEADGTLKTLASPNLVAVNGEKARFLAGGEIPIPIVQSAGTGNTSINVEFKEFGVKLDFEPTVIDSGIINLRVVPEVSQPDFSNAVVISGFLIPAFRTRRVDTVVELKDGQSLVIGGLTNTEVQKNDTGIPLLKNIPLIGYLFKNTREQITEQELVVLVSPRIIRPLEANEVPALPNPMKVKENEN
ncbi:MAG: type II and III secretion system protein family protein [Candidatus Eiseniibacteriota bacterium]